MRFTLLILALAPLASANTRPATQPAADLSDPIKTMQEYLKAIRANDEPRARACWWSPDQNKSRVLDVIVGLWVTSHESGALLVDRFGEKAARLRRDDCTDAAIDRTLSRLPASKVKFDGDTAVLKIAWDKSDGAPENPAFNHSDEPIRFVRIDGQWRIDFQAMTGLDDPKKFFEGYWGPLMAAEVSAARELIALVRSGKFQSIDQAERWLEESYARIRQEYERKHHDPR